MYFSSAILSTALLTFGAEAAFNLTAALATCKTISKQISGASQVIYPLNPKFGPAIEHWFLSSTQIPACVLNAGSDQDVATAIKIIGSDRTPFAIKSGGHATNPGFSSTQGVHIYPGNINQVVLSADKSVATIGLGQAWVDVYKKLDGTGVGVLGGRVPGPGVAGFVLGGGYGWHTNQYGLTVDTVKSYTLVLPNGTITTVDKAKPDLFFALKGGFNRFGVVTSVDMFTHPQGPVYAGLNIYSGRDFSAILNATLQFDKQNKDPRTQIITTLQAGATPDLGFAIVLFFNDSPDKLEIFSVFDGIQPVVSEVKQQSFYSFVSSVPAKFTPNIYGRFASINVKEITQGFLDLINQEITLAGAATIAHGGGPFPPSYEIDPFLDYGKYATESAYPHAESPKPLNLYFSWLSESETDFWISHMEASIQRLNDYAKAHGIYYPLAYSNYALANSTAQELFGEGNSIRLARIRKSVDPNGVMDLTGGFPI